VLTRYRITQAYKFVTLPKMYLSRQNKENKDANLSTDESRESKGLEAASVQPVLIDMSNVDLDRGVVLGRDDPVGGRAARTSKRLSYSHQRKTYTIPLRVSFEHTTSWGRRGPPSCPPRSAWWRLEGETTTATAKRKREQALRISIFIGR
jgi:hypothetical protein